MSGIKEIRILGIPTSEGGIFLGLLALSLSLCNLGDDVKKGLRAQAEAMECEEVER